MKACRAFSLTCNFVSLNTRRTKKGAQFLNFRCLVLKFVFFLAENFFRNGHSATIQSDTGCSILDAGRLTTRTSCNILEISQLLRFLDAGFRLRMLTVRTEYHLKTSSIKYQVSSIQYLIFWFRLVRVRHFKPWPRPGFYSP